MNKFLFEIGEQYGLEFKSAEQVFGGDINSSYCLQSNQGKFFIKLNKAEAYPGMFAHEAQGLATLRGKTGIQIPAIIGHGESNGIQWLLLEWVEKGAASMNFWETFGAGLATLHKNSQAEFGFANSNYIGSLQQRNDWQESWPKFYASQRLLPLCKKLFEDGLFSIKEMNLVEQSEERLSEIFPAEPPALLHGDLWSGNFMVNANGQPCMYDPAVYYGHREMDIAMSLLFGGFDRKFYTAYNGVYPLEAGWNKRLQVCQLYPLLVHAVLFGGHYVTQCKNIIQQQLL